ncbi:MAG: translational GTPase TypA [Dehalogenimonas sp.]|uniref:Large ribosomal subunit assembly factor BipA n=1 Tax=Candidatus Dehalogenimonas loeffleri TaxID=3127115 RepID=A0ABZ2J2N7_9CHLR|nr:translational GTPase TypA [Dehalogenimonas sp.]
MPKYREDIRNIAIIAHVDHGKTSLVDVMLKQSHVFRENQEVGELIMDRNALEREKGITILAKNTAVLYRDHKINIIDTPGHADFSGEVERVLNMAEGCLLLVDSTDGPMPQTRFVLQQALEKKLKPIVVVTKMDRPTRRIKEVLSMTQDLFLELATDDFQLDYPVIYSSSRDGFAVSDPDTAGTDLVPLFECILREIPPPEIEDGPLQMLVSNLDYSSHKGRIAIGRIRRGAVSPRDSVVVINSTGENKRYQINEVFTHLGLARQEVDRADAGDIIAVTGLDAVNIGETIASPERPEALPGITIGEPTVKMTFGVNTSPLAGREGKYCTSRQIRARLYRELETNISLRVEDTDSPDVFLVSGRGELHLSVLVETLRREGYEVELSKPEAITRTVDGQVMEPMEALTIDTAEECIGELTEMLAKRKGRMTNLHHDGNGNVRLEYHIPTRGLIGFRSSFLTATRGRGVMNTLFLHYEPWQGEVGSSRSGVLVASQSGTAVTYGLNNAQERGLTFIDPMTEVYEGMIVGLHARGSDLAVNVCKEKKMTNIRSSTSDISVRLTPPIKLSLEESLDFVEDDELVEVTPKNLRLRKKLLSAHDRKRSEK